MTQSNSTSRKHRWKQILQIAWPLILANSFWNLQLTIDRIFLGQFSTEALGAAPTVMGVFWTPMALLQQTAAYLTTFVAQYHGAHQPRNIGPALWQAVYISIAGGILFLVFIPGAESFFMWMGHPATTAAIEGEYFAPICYSALPAALIAAASGFYGGLGKTQTVMWINCVGLIANAILDYLLIFGHLGFPALGVAGAGYATALANYISAGFAFYWIFTSENEKQYGVLSGWKWHGDLLRRYLRYGLPSGLQWALEGLAFTVFLIIIGRMENAEAALAASGIATTVLMLAILPPMGIAQAVMIQVGQFLGEKAPEKAVEFAWSGFQVVFFYIVPLGCTFVLFPQLYLGLFENAGNPELWQQVAQIAPYLLMFVAFFTCFDCTNIVFSFALKGAGDTRFVSLVALLLPWPLMVLPTWWIQDWPGAIYWAWGAASVYSVVLAMVFLGRFQGGKWKQMSVIG